MTAFGDAWLEDLGAAPPTKFGPQPAPAGPVPSAWTGEVGGSAPPAAATSVPGASAEVAPTPGSPANEPSTALLLAVIVIIAIGVVGVVAFRRRHPGSGTAR
jgi:hypothetical protein